MQTWHLNLLTIFPNSQGNAMHDSGVRIEHYTWANFKLPRAGINTSQPEPEGAWLAKPTWGAGALSDKLPFAGLCCCSHAAGNKSAGPDRAHSGRPAQAALTPLMTASAGPAMAPFRICPQTHHPDSSCQLWWITRFIKAAGQETALALFACSHLTYSSGKVLSLLTLAISCQDN